MSDKKSTITTLLNNASTSGLIDDKSLSNTAILRETTPAFPRSLERPKTLFLFIVAQPLINNITCA